MASLNPVSPMYIILLPPQPITKTANSVLKSYLCISRSKGCED